MDSFKNAFKGFDINDLDFNTAGTWPIGVKIITYLIVFSAIIFLGMHFYVSEKITQLDRAIAKEQELKQQYQAKAYQVASLDALRKQMADVEERFAVLLQQLPTQKEVPGLLDDITTIGRESGLDIASIALADERKEAFYIELPINITVTGSYHQMGQFVSGVAATPRIVTLHDYDIKTAGNDQLTMNLSAKTYRYDDTN
ncbi:type IV pilus inner membrane component PilO [Marinobacterium jannaschii]|uniref:type 4a pilus biogenesis protein PilO n=1 Tax=Marinobacterium jannaschii TaxID=64970 RepID=UPI000484334E|nr:type 4a pilus biogenesis protein PilO [Marinobacterium jannaschii]